MCQECYEEIPSEVAKQYKLKTDINSMNCASDKEGENSFEEL